MHIPFEVCTHGSELHSDELVVVVDFHALALRLEDSGLLGFVLALAHEAFFVRSGYDRHGARSGLGQTGEHLEVADLRYQPVELTGALGFRHLRRKLQVLLDDVADDVNVDGLTSFVAGIVQF